MGITGGICPGSDVPAKSKPLGPSGSEPGYELPPLESWTLFSNALKLRECFFSTQLLTVQLGAKFLVQFRVMPIYRAYLGVITYIPQQLMCGRVLQNMTTTEVCLPWYPEE